MIPFEAHDQDDHRKVLAEFLPSGSAFNAKSDPDSNFFKLLLGLAAENVRMDDLVAEIMNDYDIENTTFMIDLWESAVGIPDDCFTNTASLDQRRKQVLIKLAVKADTRQSFIDIAHYFGFQCTITSGRTLGVYPLPYPWTYFGSYKDARFTMVVNLETSAARDVYPFNITNYPWPYSSPNNNMIECLFRHLARSNVQVIFKYIL